MPGRLRRTPTAGKKRAGRVTADSLTGAAISAAAAATGKPTRTRRRRRAQSGGDVPAATAALSQALREARHKSGLSQRAAADKVGVHFVTIYTWENERRHERPTDENLARAAKVYGTNAAAIKRRAAALEGTAASADTADAGSNAASVEREVPIHAVARLATADQSADDSNGEGLQLPRRVYARVFRLLADLAEHSELAPEQLAGAQRALTAPGLMQVFASLSSAPLSEGDAVAAIDAAAVAVQTFVASRRG
jgi:transcriptional regulator with XRE-family HTH domain